ncbi:MAG: hypothetical protein WD825_02245 [Gemmatimonadaceae bacterium]
MKRAGWTLHELLISMGVFAGVVGITSHLAAGQLRFFRGIGEATAVRSQVGQATTIAAGMLWGVSPGGGDIIVAQDSAIELHLPMGSALTCGGVPGRLTIPVAAATSGNALSAFSEQPEAGDRVLAFFDDSLGATWLALRLSSAPIPGASCAHFPSVTSAWTLESLEQVTVPAGASLRFTRPFRLSLYRASDGRWYLGGKDWNGAADRFNSIQPVAGPLKPYSPDPAQTGLRLLYRDLDGDELTSPVDSHRIASVTVIARGGAGQFEDSSVTVVALRNAR